MKTPKHSKIGASSCERWWNCPGSVALIETTPPQPESEYAREGSAAHLVGEWCLRTNRDAAEYVGHTIVQVQTKKGEKRFEFEADARTLKEATKIGNDITVTDEMAEAVQVYLDTIRNDMKKFNVHESDLSIEHRFHLTHIDDDAYGTNDCNIKVAFVKIIVYDYKHGSGVAVEAEDNRQGLYYALGAAYGEEFDEIEIVIVQPRAVHKAGPVRRWSVSKTDLEAYGNELKTKIAATRVNNAPRKCGEWCKKTFCAAISVCPEVRQTVETAAMTVFKDPGIEARLPRPEALDAPQLRRLLEAIPLIDTWAKSVMAYAENQMNNGQKVPGFKLVRGGEGHRKWVDGAEIDLNKAVSALNCNREIPIEIYERVLLSPAQLEKKEKSLKAITPKLTSRKQGKIIMVPESDPREAVSPNVIEVFAEEQEQLT